MNAFLSFKIRSFKYENNYGLLIVYLLEMKKKDKNKPSSTELKLKLRKYAEVEGTPIIDVSVRDYFLPGREKSWKGKIIVKLIFFVGIHSTVYESRKRFKYGKDYNGDVKDESTIAKNHKPTGNSISQPFTMYRRNTQVNILNAFKWPDYIIKHLLRKRSQ